MSNCPSFPVLTKEEAKELYVVCGPDGEHCPKLIDWLNRIYILKEQLSMGNV